MAKVRIIGGKLRRRNLTVLAETDLRPTLDRVKETLFNWLGQDLTNLNCLDLFAGSGSLGFEALSRNAKCVVMVDNNPRIIKNLQANAKLFNFENCQIIQMNALEYLDSAKTKFDIIFVDPPFNSKLLDEVLPMLKTILNKDGLIYIEYATPPLALADYSIAKKSKAGLVHYALLGLGV